MGAVIKSPHCARLVVWRLLAVMAIVMGAVWFVILPNYVNGGLTEHTRIWNRLRQLDAAKESWALENRIAEGVEPSRADLTPYLSEGFWDRPVAGEKCIINPYNKGSDDSPTWDDLRPYFPDWATNGLVRWTNGPVCPEGGIYTIGRVGETPRCSIGGYSHAVSP